MRVLGIDPGTERIGFGVVEGARHAPRAVQYGVLPAVRGQEETARLLAIYRSMVRLLRWARPSLVAVERLYFARNVTSALSVGQARGVVLLAVARAGIPVREYTPAEVKQAVVGVGNAGKGQVQHMVGRLLALPEAPHPDDAADALAVALCALERAWWEDVQSRSVGYLGADGGGRP